MRRLATPLALLALLAAVTAAYGHLVWRGEVPHSRHSDLLTFNLAALTLLHDSLGEGHGIPLWRSDELAGYPAVTNPQLPFLHLPVLALAGLPPLRATSWLYLLHFGIAGVGGWLLGASLGLGRGGCSFLAFGCAFQHKLMLAAYTGWLPWITVIALLPLLFAAGARALARPGIVSLLAVAGAVALCLAAGAFQLTYYAAMLLALAAAFQLWRERRPDLRRALPGPATLALGGLLALPLAAPVWLPLVTEAPLLSRGDGSYAFFLAGHALSPGHLLTLLHPELLGSPFVGDGGDEEIWEHVAYFGVVPLLLAGIALARARGRRTTRWLAAGCGLSLLLALDTPLVRLLYELLPGFSLFRAPGRFLFLASLLGVALGAVGADALLRRAAATGRTRAVRLVLALALLAITAEGAFYARRYLSTAPPSELLPEAAFAGRLASGPEPFRVAPIGRETLNYGWAAPMGLELVTGYDPYNLRRYQDYLDLLRFGEVREGVRVWSDLQDVPRLDMLAALNVRYVVSQQPLAAAGAGLREVAHLRDQPAFAFYDGRESLDLRIYELTNSRPRAFFARSVVANGDAWAEVRRRDLRRVAIVEDPAAAAPSPPSPGDAVRILEARAGALRFATETSARRFVVASEVWHPGWDARIDGAPAPLLRVDGALLGLWVPAGSHTIELAFRPVAWDAALWTSGATALGCAALGVLGTRRRRA